MRNLFFNCLIAFFLTGCVHYFEKNSETRVERNIPKIQNICLRRGVSLADSEVMDSENYRFGSIYSLVQKKFNITNGCEQKTPDFQVVIYDYEKAKWDEFWKVTIGIFPGVYAKTWTIRIFGADKELVLDKQLNGTLIISIFFTPFFFLHKGPDEIIFDELDTYFKNHIIIDNSLK